MSSPTGGPAASNMASSTAAGPAGSPAAPLLEVDSLRIAFAGERGGDTLAVEDVSFDVPAETTVALVGESGSGKSVSAMAVIGLLPPSARVGGSVRFEGRELLGAGAASMRALRGARIAMVFQEPMSSLNPVLPVGEQIAEVLRLHRGAGARAARARAIELLAEVGLPEPAQRARAYPHQLSGGQQQRAMIAMALACEPRLLIADEPTTALDVTVQAQLLELLRRLRREYRMSLLFITHDLGVVAELADEVVVMRAGRVLERAPADALFAAPAHPYTRALLACRPPLDVRPDRLPVIADETAMVIESSLGGPAPAPPADSPVLLEVRGLSKTYRMREGLLGRREVAAVRDVSLRLRRGRTLGLVGESGSGKSTVGLSLLRLQPVDGGQALFEGTDLLRLDERAWAPWRRRLQIVFQNPYASLNPRFTVAQTLLEPMRLHGIGEHQADRLDLARALLDRVGLPADALARYPHEFSGGQRQRIAIARALAVRPDVIVCDEPVSALDVSVQAQVLNLLRDLQQRDGLTYLFISHDLAVVRFLADEVAVMKDGRVVECADSETLYREPAHPYTRALLAAVPRGRRTG